MLRFIDKVADKSGVRTQTFLTLSTTPELSPSQEMNSAPKGIPPQPQPNFTTMLQSHVRKLWGSSEANWYKVRHPEKQNLSFLKGDVALSPLVGGWGRSRGIVYNYSF